MIFMTINFNKIRKEEENRCRIIACGRVKSWNLTVNPDQEMVSRKMRKGKTVIRLWVGLASNS